MWERDYKTGERIESNIEKYYLISGNPGRKSWACALV